MAPRHRTSFDKISFLRRRLPGASWLEARDGHRACPVALVPILLLGGSGMRTSRLLSGLARSIGACAGFCRLPALFEYQFSDPAHRRHGALLSTADGGKLGTD